jgi:hypothetical protein
VTGSVMVWLRGQDEVFDGVGDDVLTT